MKSELIKSERFFLKIADGFPIVFIILNNNVHVNFNFSRFFNTYLSV